MISWNITIQVVTDKEKLKADREELGRELTSYLLGMVENRLIENEMKRMSLSYIDVTNKCVLKDEDVEMTSDAYYDEEEGNIILCKTEDPPSKKRKRKGHNITKPWVSTVNYSEYEYYCASQHH